jgi:hypothetical protein
MTVGTPGKPARDAITERHVFCNLLQLECRTILIAHRFSTIVAVDPVPDVRAQWLWAAEREPFGRRTAAAAASNREPVHGRAAQPRGSVAHMSKRLSAVQRFDATLWPRVRG